MAIVLSFRAFWRDDVADMTSETSTTETPHSVDAIHDASTAAHTRPAGAKKVPVSLVMAIALVVVLAGLGVWAAVGNMAAQSTSGWEFVQAGSGYSTSAPEVAPGPAIPASAHMTPAQLPPIAQTTVSANVTLKIDSGPLGGTYGPNGQVVDSFSPALFAVPAGETVHVTVYNYDTAWHTFTAPSLGLNVWFTPHVSDSQPSKTTFTFTAPRAGYYQWNCATPCDPFSMATAGYMEGYVHAVKA